jgi:hypothetical protein
VSSAQGSQPGPARRAGIDPRWYSSTLLTLILVVGQWRFQILGDDWRPWMVALGTALGAEFLLARFVAGRRGSLLSAYISGNSVAILLKAQGPILWPFALASALSITSKHVLAWRGRHLWNPTNFGLCALLLLASERVSILSHQWSNDLAAVLVLWAVGGLTVWRAGIAHVTLAWLGAFVACAALRAALLPDGRFLTELAPVTGPLYTLFMFFMVTDPRTQVRGRARQALVAGLVAAAECTLRLAAEWDLLRPASPLAAAPALYALFAVGPAALALELACRPPPAAAERPVEPGTPIPSQQASPQGPRPAAQPAPDQPPQQAPAQSQARARTEPTS